MPKKLVQLVATVILDGLTEEAASAYAELLAHGRVSSKLQIGTSSWPVNGAAAIINIIEEADVK